MIDFDTSKIMKALLKVICPGHRKEQIKELLNRDDAWDLITHKFTDEILINNIDETLLGSFKNCKGEIHLMIASTEYEVKRLTYDVSFYNEDSKCVITFYNNDNVKFIEREQEILSKYKNRLNQSIKTNLGCEVEFKGFSLDKNIDKIISRKTNEEDVEEDTKMYMEWHEEIVKRIINKAQNVSENSHLEITAYYNEDVFGVNLSFSDGTIVTDIIVMDKPVMSLAEKIDHMNTAISLAKSISVYLNSKNLESQRCFVSNDDMELDGNIISEVGFTYIPVQQHLMLAQG